MRILMINVVCGIRSTGRICTDLAKALQAKGHTVRIAYGRETVPDAAKPYAVRIGADTDVKLHAVRARLTDGCGYGSKRATERFLDWVRDYDPDVIHLHNLHGYYLNLPLLFGYLRTCGKKILWTLHDCWAFTGHSAFCDAVSCERWADGCHDCPKVREYPASLIDRSAQNWQDRKRMFTGIPNLRIVTPSEWMAKVAQRSFFGAYPITVIRSGIDLRKFYPSRNDTKESFRIPKQLLLFAAADWTEDVLQSALPFLQRLNDDRTALFYGLSETQRQQLPCNARAMEPTASSKELEMLCHAADGAVLFGTPEAMLSDALRDAKTPIVATPEDANKLPLCAPDNADAAGFWATRKEFGLLGKRVLLGVQSDWGGTIKGLSEYDRTVENRSGGNAAPPVCGCRLVREPDVRGYPFDDQPRSGGLRNAGGNVSNGRQPGERDGNRTGLSEGRYRRNDTVFLQNGVCFGVGAAGVGGRNAGYGSVSSVV